MSRAEDIARAFHETYERLAPDHGYKTREASAKPWSEVPEQNKGLMIAVVQSLIDRGVIGTAVVEVHVQVPATPPIVEAIQQEINQRRFGEVA